MTHMTKRDNGANKSRKRVMKWLNSFDKASAAVEKHGNLLNMLAAGDGICKIENFLPDFVAQGVFEILEGMQDEQWNVTAADDDYTHNNISHDFLSSKSQNLESIFRVFTLLLPDSLFTFSAAKYCRAGHIKPHDDRAFTKVCMEDGSIQLCSRTIAVIYYLTKDWSAADGGVLIDHEAKDGPQTYVPQFNSVIAFTIPRWHEVTPVVTDRPRYSIFGWFLEPGQLYDLNLDPNPPPKQQQQAKKSIKRKHGSKDSTLSTAGNPSAATAGGTGKQLNAAKKRKGQKSKGKLLQETYQALQQPLQPQLAGQDATVRGLCVGSAGPQRTAPGQRHSRKQLQCHEPKKLEHGAP